MPRRVALALSLAFTTIVTFSLVALGVNAGFFSDAKKSATTQRAQAAGQPPPGDVDAALRYLAAVADQTAQAGTSASSQPSGPRVITEYVYLYETPVAGAPRRTGPAAQAVGAPTQAPAAEAPRSENEPVDEGDDKQPTVGAPPPKAPTSAPSSVAPTSTPKPAPSATQPAAPPTSAPPAPQPTAPPAQAACNDEFESLVTAMAPISGGKLVTWSNGVQTRALDSTAHASALHVGVRAHVHTTQSGGCTVTEIELDN